MMTNSFTELGLVSLNNFELCACTGGVALPGIRDSGKSEQVPLTKSGTSTEVRVNTWLINVIGGWDQGIWVLYDGIHLEQGNLPPRA